jgi:DNA-binding transcriptional MerR regulator
MSSFTIKDIENLSGIKAHTLRIWEQRYNFLKPERSFTNIRHYSGEELKIILNIALLNKYGYKVSHIDKMNAAEIKEKITSLAQAEAQQERIVNELVQTMVDVDLVSFEFVLNNYILARGIERTISQIIFPFLEKIGMLWLTNHINPAQEHLVTNIIRQKLIVGIEGLQTPLHVNKTVLLFLPEGEHHELGLIFMHYIFKSRGCSVIYLGANIPLRDVEYLVKLKSPDFLYTHLTSVAKSFNFEKFLSGLQDSFAGTPIIISGALTNGYTKKVPEPVTFKHSFKEVMDFVTNLEKSL